MPARILVPETTLLKEHIRFAK
ncbi:hypothetical protein SCAR479_02335 [Seiridium cardinale]|uniref:Uncharacterized protein n=1 Tax=Seiridium cardinale TaxID=138064 RepID=A0ABR2X661_9PEZI